MTNSVSIPDDFTGTLEEYQELDDLAFAQEWKVRYQALRSSMIPDVARWMRLLRFFHPRGLDDHWQDSFGNPAPKLWQSQGLSLEIYNWCRPIIEVYGSLLAGQKPMPFIIDVDPGDTTSQSEIFKADAQQKLIEDEIWSQKIPMHFLDFCTSLMLFGIAYVYSWIDEDTRRLNTQAISWPGDVLPQWGSNRYGNGSEALESCILTERLPIDVASRKYPDHEFQATAPDVSFRPDSRDAMTLQGNLMGSVTVLKVWWRGEGNQIGYAEIAYDATPDNTPQVLYRNDDTGYPDIPVRWAARFATPGEAPHRAAGVLDDIVGINTEYDEKLSAFSDMIQKLVYTKYAGKGFSIGNVPRLAPGSNIYPMGVNQDLKPLQEQINNFPFDSFLGRLENMMMTIAGLSKLMMGSVPPGDSSGEALNNLMHASIGRLEVVRTPIQWCWTSLIDEIWVPLLTKYYRGKTVDQLTGRQKTVKMDFIFDGYRRIRWTWPDVTPRDALRTAQVAMQLGQAGYLSDESVMQRAGVPSMADEFTNIKRERQDVVLKPESVRNTALAKMSLAQLMQMQNPQPQKESPVKISLTGKLDPVEIQEALSTLGIQPTGGESAGATVNANEKMGASVADQNVKAQAERQPMLDEAAGGTMANAAQGVNNAPGTETPSVI